MTKPTLGSKANSMHGFENCRVVEIGIEKFAECLQQGPNTCSHALPFGYCFLCQHPRLAEIIENTKRAQPALEPLK